MILKLSEKFIFLAQSGQNQILKKYCDFGVKSEGEEINKIESMQLLKYSILLSNLTILCNQ